MKQFALVLLMSSIVSPSWAQGEGASSVNIQITGRTEGAYNIGATVRPMSNARRPRPMLDTNVADAINSDQQTNSAQNGQGNNSSRANSLVNQQGSRPSSASAGSSSTGNPLLDKALNESDHHAQGSSGGSVSAKDFEKGLLGDFAVATATHEDYAHYLEGVTSRMKDFLQSAAESELPILEVQSIINNVQRALQEDARRRQGEEFENQLAEAMGALQPSTASEIQRAINESPDPPKPPIDTSAPLDDQRRQAVDNDDYNHLATVARQGTGGNLRRERDHFAEAMSAAANVAGNENATPAERAAARQFAQNLAGYFHSLGGRMSDDPLFTDSCNVLSATCDNIAHWTDPPW